MASSITAPKAQLLERLRQIAPELEAAARQAELERCLPPQIVGRLRELGLFWLKTPVELGGTELDPVDFFDVLEQVAYHDASAAWAVMVGNGTTGYLAGRLSDDGAARIFRSGEPLPVLAGQFVRPGTATREGDGYRVTGRWTFCSGITHADWVAGSFDDGTGSARIFCIPRHEATLHDTWHVAGLQGTGSGDFSVTDHLVPAAHTVDALHEPPKRGGPLFRQPIQTFVGNELGPVAMGIARRAVDDMRDLGAGAGRALAGAPLRDRESFQRALGLADARLTAVRGLARDVVASGWQRFLQDGRVDERTLALGMARTTYGVHSCAELVAELFRFGGGRVLSLDHPMQRHVRNLIAAGQHLGVSDENYEIAGRALLDGLERPSPSTPR